MIRAPIRSSSMVFKRSFHTTLLKLSTPPPSTNFKTSSKLSDVTDKNSLLGLGSSDPKKIPTDIEQSTGLERFELLGQLEGVEVFDNQVLDSSRTGTLTNPIVVDSYDDYRYVGCTGAPLDSHVVQWLKPTTEKVARCWECGSVYKLNFLGDLNNHHHH